MAERSHFMSQAATASAGASVFVFIITLERSNPCAVICQQREMIATRCIHATSMMRSQSVFARHWLILHRL